MKKTLFSTTLLASFSIMFCSCAGSKNFSENKYDMTGTWNIVTAMDKSTKGGDKEPEITFGKDGKIHGNASVNSFFGGYTQKGNVIEFSNMGSTRMMGKSMDIEQAISEAFEKTHTVKVKGNKATVYDKSGRKIMTMKKK